MQGLEQTVKHKDRELREVKAQVQVLQEKQHASEQESSQLKAVNEDLTQQVATTESSKVSHVLTHAHNTCGTTLLGCPTCTPGDIAV